MLENQDTVGPLENEPKSTFHFSAIESSGNQDWRQNTKHTH